jgi:hypothetical protein
MERLIEAGVKGFLIFDCGLLKLVKDLKENGYLPKDIVVKASVVAGAGSPVTAKLIQDVGASTVNPLGDITLPQLAAMRKVIDIPMDVYMTVVQAMGGMHRYHQAAELARIGSPVYFKFEPGDAEGNIYKEYCEIDYNNFLNRQKIIQAQCTIEWINRYNPEIKCSAPGPDDLTLCDPK